MKSLEKLKAYLDEKFDEADKRLETNPEKWTEIWKIATILVPDKDVAIWEDRGFYPVNDKISSIFIGHGISWMEMSVIQKKIGWKKGAIESISGTVPMALFRKSFLIPIPMKALSSGRQGRKRCFTISWHLPAS